jgi:hypothetical protein
MAALFEELTKTKSLRFIADKLNLCVGTVKRWQELKSVPEQYTFDLLKLLERQIDYGEFTCKVKDQFFTPKNVAEHCWKVFNTLIDSSGYTFIEPSAGDGSFMKLLPLGSIGLDIEPRVDGLLRQDFLLWKPDTGKYIVFGNPPFGLRGHLALQFINHSATFADYVCFILPQLFESDGKGSPRKRVRGLNLVHSENISASFHTPDKTCVKVNGVFQIWSKHKTNSAYTIHGPNEALRVYSLSDGGTIATTRNKAMLDQCDIYLPSTCFGRENMRVYNTFEELPNEKGYGIVFNNKNMIGRARDICWADVAFLSTNSALNLRTSLIEGQFLTE